MHKTRKPHFYQLETQNINFQESSAKAEKRHLKLEKQPFLNSKSAMKAGGYSLAK